MFQWPDFWTAMENHIVPLQSLLYVGDEGAMESRAEPSLKDR
jgi:hypothetical protein